MLLLLVLIGNIDSLYQFLASAVDAARKAGEVSSFILKWNFSSLLFCSSYSIPSTLAWCLAFQFQFIHSLLCRSFDKVSTRPSMSSTKARFPFHSLLSPFGFFLLPFHIILLLLLLWLCLCWGKISNRAFFWVSPRKRNFKWGIHVAHESCSYFHYYLLLVLWFLHRLIWSLKLIKHVKNSYLIISSNFTPLIRLLQISLKLISFT